MASTPMPENSKSERVDQTRLPEKDNETVNIQDDDETSSSGSSTLTDDESEDEPEGRQKDARNPRPLITQEPASTDIHNRLASFFSQLAERRSRPGGENDEIIEKDENSDSGFEDDQDAGQQYIELDLAMGVLSEEPEGKKFDDVELPNDDDEDDTSASDSEPLQKLSSIAEAKDVSKADKQRKPKKRKIEELG